MNSSGKIVLILFGVLIVIAIGIMFLNGMDMSVLNFFWN